MSGRFWKKALFILVLAVPIPALAEDRPVEEAHKNIQVLKGMPESQLDPVMDLMKGSLGVNCGFCHVNTGDKWEMEKDDKQEKKVARQMIQMVLDVNRTTFQGKTVVTCYTCHRGETKPASEISLPVAAARKPEPAAAKAAPALPSAKEVLDRYVAAVGGSEVASKVKSLAVKGTREQTGGRPGPLEFYQDGADRILFVFTTPGGAVLQGLSEKGGWFKSPRGQREMDPEAVQHLRESARLFQPLKAPASAEGLSVVGSETIGDGEAWVVERKNPEGATRYFFDKQSGLLVRMHETVDTRIGPLPDQTDFQDYRDVAGLKLPFTIVTSDADPWHSAVHKLTEMTPNASIDKGKFDPPSAGK